MVYKVGGGGGMMYFTINLLKIGEKYTYSAKKWGGYGPPPPGVAGPEVNKVYVTVRDN